MKRLNRQRWFSIFMVLYSIMAFAFMTAVMHVYVYFRGYPTEHPRTGLVGYKFLFFLAVVAAYVFNRWRSRRRAVNAGLDKPAQRSLPVGRNLDA